ncbi:DNA replication protein DnaD [Lactiplantibacillus plantarum subsp. plantarum]|uniref:DNA replication protein DnaD n=1 Tax=Lactiplantibacillus plantarum TaxID=1590 RepID=UPI000CD377C6|nr:DNA replication protein DnaD [Lactiplantibacillus plantarum]AUV72190.1 DNA replication protein DnaD [Lactiplantibacillus plantarum subsp. plantarum]
MDYFKQRRAYRKLKRDQIDISIGQNNLYRELLDYANDEYQLDNVFTLKNSALLDLTGMSDSGLKVARNELVQLGLIKYVPGKRNKQKPQYQIIRLYSTSWATRNDNSSSTSNPSSSSTGTPDSSPTGSSKELTSTVPDSTDTKKKNKDPRDLRRQEFLTDVWAIYPRQEKFGDAWNAYYRATVTGANPAGKATKSQIIQGIGNYKRYLEVKGTQGQYVQQLANWLDNGGWLSNYDMTPPKPKGKSGAGRKEIIPKWAQNGASQADSKPNSSDNQQDDMSDEDFLALMNSQEEAK